MRTAPYLRDCELLVRFWQAAGSAAIPYPPTYFVQWIDGISADCYPGPTYRANFTAVVPDDGARDSLSAAVALAHGLPAESAVELLGTARAAFIDGFHVAACVSAVSTSLMRRSHHGVPFTVSQIWTRSESSSSVAGITPAYPPCRQLGPRVSLRTRRERTAG
jgi:hypothetical protein